MVFLVPKRPAQMLTLFANAASLMLPSSPGTGSVLRWSAPVATEDGHGSTPR